jgi:hypothetical protein
MASGDEPLRELIRLIPPARALRRNLEESIHMERYAGVGVPSVRLYRGLYERACGLSDDSYLASLRLDLREAALEDESDEEKVTTAHFYVSQLLAFLEAQTGVAGTGEGERGLVLAPKVQFAGPVNYVASENLMRILNGEKKTEDEAAG